MWFVGIRQSTPKGVTLKGISKAFNKNEATVNIKDWEIAASEFVTLVGPSGCGKTTTMRMIAGLEDPTAGDIYFGSRSVINMSVQRRNIAMVFQNYALYPHMSVRENLEYGLKKRGVPYAERKERVAWAASLLRIDGMLERKPRQLSGGEQQRVALGRAIIRTPDVLLLDEPLSNLDAKLRTFMRAELVKLQRQIGCTTIFVTHDQLEAMTMSDRIAVMNQGQILQFATPEEVYNYPANLFIAGFVGSPPMNFVKGEISEHGDHHIFRAQGMVIKFPAGSFSEDANFPSHQQVTLGIRPEHILPGDSSGDFDAVVNVVELIGAEKHVFLGTATGEMILRVNADVHIVPGDRISCTMQRPKIRFFSDDDGAAVGILPRGRHGIKQASK